MILIPLFSACSSGSQKKEHPLKTKVIAQIDQSVEIPGVIFQKSVLDLQKENSTREDSVFKTEIAALIKNEVGYAYEYYYDDPLSAEYLTVSTNNDTVIASLSAENDHKLNLKRQKVLWDKNQEKILYLESHILKKSWLYTLVVDVSIQFDSTGQYRSHQMHLSNTVPLISSGIDAMVNGKLIYP